MGKLANFLSPVILLVVVGSFLPSSLGQQVESIETNRIIIIEAGSLGLVKGNVKSTLTGPKRQYYNFNGMRYAEAPTGDRRFLPSIRTSGELSPIPGGIFDGTKVPVACAQPSLSFFPTPQSEDCLFMNVDTPKLYTGSTRDSLPVIVNIHGGAFTIGQGSLYNGARLLNRDVVVVTFNYRLGLLGFYSLMNEDVPGNAAMYDTINALNWVKDNIRYFGGDPNRVTITGESSGSATVTHLLTSPMAQGLFHGAIAASGSSLAAWGTTDNPMRGSLAVAELSNCFDPATEDPQRPEIIDKIAKCMRTVPFKTLVEALQTFQIKERNDGRLGFDAVSPTVQSFPMTTVEKFLPKHPRDVLEAGEQINVPLIMGTTRHDGSYVLGVFYNRYLKDNDLVNNTEFMKKDAVPNIMKALSIPNEYGVYDSIAKMYLGETRKSGDFMKMYPGFIDLFSVFFFKASAYQTALYHSLINNHTYWYSFDYAGPQTVFPILFLLEPVPFYGGVTHGDDLMYIFELGEFLEPAEEAVSNRMVDYYANFAIYGNPTPPNYNFDSPVWESISPSQPRYLSIDKESLQLEHFEDYWSDIGWEVEPTEAPPSESTSDPQTSTTEITASPSPTDSTITTPPPSTTTPAPSPTTTTTVPTTVPTVTSTAAPDPSTTSITTTTPTTTSTTPTTTSTTPQPPPDSTTTPAPPGTTPTEPTSPEPASSPPTSPAVPSSSTAKAKDNSGVSLSYSSILIVMTTVAAASLSTCVHA